MRIDQFVILVLAKGDDNMRKAISILIFLSSAYGFGSEPLDKIKDREVFDLGDNGELPDFKFSDENTENYVKAHFKAVGAAKFRSKEKAKRFLKFLKRAGNEKLQELCRTPIILKLMCLAYDDNKEYIDEMDPIDIVPYMYEEILISLARQFLKKHNSLKESQLTSLDVCEKSKMYIAFNEHIAFMVAQTKSDKQHALNTEQYLNLDSGWFGLKDGQNFGFLLSTSDDGFQRFIHDTFQHFFCARYLISCLRKECGFVNNSQNIHFPYEHHWYEIEGCKTAGMYVGLKSTEKSFEPMHEFIKGILNLYKDRETLAYFDYCRRP